MAHFADLTPHTYTPSCGLDLLNVGWLDDDQSFDTGPAVPDFLDALYLLCQNPIHLHRGEHTCWFCEAYHGNGQIRVRGKSGVWFAAPTLIYHYVAHHNYLPPAEFIDAVLQEAAHQRSPVCIASAITGAVWAKVRVPK